MRNYSFAPGEFYHVYSRGVDKRDIFMDFQDRERFKKLLFYCNGTRPTNMRSLPRGLPFADGHNRRGDPIVEIGAYCLMPNHFHLLIREPTGEGISRFMLKLLTGYSYYFNIRYQRKGRLFSSSFQSKHSDSDEYLKYLFAYIHLNPLKLRDPYWKLHGIKDTNEVQDYLLRYTDSSFHEYAGINRDEKHILDVSNFPRYFLTGPDFVESLEDWIKYTEGNPLYVDKPPS
jgi:putative transposase